MTASRDYLIVPIFSTAPPLLSPYEPPPKRYQPLRASEVGSWTDFRRNLKSSNREQTTRSTASAPHVWVRPAVRTSGRGREPRIASILYVIDAHRRVTHSCGHRASAKITQSSSFD